MFHRPSPLPKITFPLAVQKETGLFSGKPVSHLQQSFCNGSKRIAPSSGFPSGQKFGSSGKQCFRQSVGMGVQIGLDFSHGFQSLFLNGGESVQTLEFFDPEVDSRPDLGPIDRAVYRISQPEILPAGFVVPHTGKAAAPQQALTAPGIPVVLILFCLAAALHSGLAVLSGQYHWRNHVARVAPALHVVKLKRGAGTAIAGLCLPGLCNGFFRHRRKKVAGADFWRNSSLAARS